MADTGILSFNASSGTATNHANLLSGTTTCGWIASTSIYAIVTDAGDDNFPAGSTVNGVEVFLTDLWKGSLWSQTVTLTTDISLDGGSNWSSTTVEQVVGLLQTADYTQGSSTNTWGLDWSGFTDLNQLAVRLTSDPGTGFAAFSCELCQIKVYYTEVEVITPRIKLLSGKLSLKGGQLIIK